MRVIRASLRLLLLLLFSSFISPSSSSSAVAVAVAVRVPISPLRRRFADELAEIIRRESVDLLSAMASSLSLAAPFAELAGGGEGGFHQKY
jgi:hypothetical protein